MRTCIGPPRGDGGKGERGGERDGSIDCCSADSSTTGHNWPCIMRICTSIYGIPGLGMWTGHEPACVCLCVWGGWPQPYGRAAIISIYSVLPVDTRFNSFVRARQQGTHRSDIAPFWGRCALPSPCVGQAGALSRTFSLHSPQHLLHGVLQIQR
jgi:hypothetical protein